MTVLIVNDEKWTADMIREDVDWRGCGGRRGEDGL